MINMQHEEFETSLERMFPRSDIVLYGNGSLTKDEARSIWDRAIEWYSQTLKERIDELFLPNVDTT